MSTTRTFRAMGTECQVSVYGDASDALADLAVQRVELLEDCWSRFRPNSELNRLNARAGSGLVPASDDLRLLVEAMQAGWAWTDGLFDPTILASMRAIGYDVDFTKVLAREFLLSVSVDAAPGMSGVVIDDDAVSLPTGIGIDPGAIGKGLAADVVVDELMNAGAQGVLVSLGGDIVIAGEPDAAQWSIAVVDERRDDDTALTTLVWDAPVDRVAIATSTTLRRRWANGRHHVIDPRTGDVAQLELVQASVVAIDGWQAEVATTAALLLGPVEGQAWLDAHGLQGYLLTADELVGV